MPRPRGRRTASISRRIDERRKRYDEEKLAQAIRNFFVCVDEDGNGSLELHEFAVAQVVVAELAEDNFDADAAVNAFKDMRSFDANRDGHVSESEFVARMMDLCQVLPQRKEALVTELAERAALVLAHSRREVVSEIRRFFQSLDGDKSGALDKREMESLLRIVLGMTSELGADFSYDEQIAEFLALEEFDKSKDGLVELDEFVDRFLAFTKRLNISKRDIVLKLRSMQDLARAGPGPPEVGALHRP